MEQAINQEIEELENQEKTLVGWLWSERQCGADCVSDELKGKLLRLLKELKTWGLKDRDGHGAEKKTALAVGVNWFS
jgi:cation transport ATPase